MHNYFKITDSSTFATGLYNSLMIMQLKT